MDVPGTPATSERRIVSVLFADLVGFTTLAEGLDPEDLATIQDAYFGTVRDIVGRYRGSLEKFIGDAAMAVFGTPRAEDDDAVRAVQAGLALVHAIGDLGARLGLEAQDLRLRVGVNTGEVLVATGGPDAGRVSGDTVNVAARLQTAADPGGMLVGELTALSIAHAVELEAVEPLALKGKTKPVPASRVVGLHPEPSRELAMGRLRAPMLGRENELELLRTAAEAADAGTAGRVLVVAPPGVGKTRLLDALSEQLGGGGWHLVRGRAAPGGSAFDAIARLVRAAFGGTAAPDGAGIADAIRETLDGGRGDVVARDVLSLLAPGADAASRDRAGLFASLAEAIGSVSGGRPQAWILEDLHWAGGDLLAFLDAASTVPGARRLIVASARPHLLDAPSLGDWKILHLPTLSPVACTAVLQSLVGDAVPPSLAAAIVARSDGNCLFVEELLRTWASVGLLAFDDGRWRLTTDAADVPLPRTVQAIYAAQLDDLPTAPRAVIRRAAVAGRRFPASALDPLGIDEPADALETLTRRAILTGPLSADLLGEAYGFRHALLRDAGYASLGRAERADLHVRLARWLEAATGERAGEVSGEIGRHYADALEAAPALGPLPGGMDRPAIAALARHWLAAAADRDLERFATASAAEGYRRAISLTPADDHLALAGFRRRLGQALARDALDESIEASLAAVEDARAVLTTPGVAAADAAAARDILARAATDASIGRYEQVRFAEALAIADGAIAELHDDRLADRVLLARLRAREGLDNDYVPLAAEAHALADRAAARGDGELAFEARRIALALDTSHGESTAAAWTSLADDAAALGRVEVAASSIANAAMLAFDTDREQAFELLDRAEELAGRYAIHDRLGWIGHTRTELCLATGDWGRAREAGRGAIALAIPRNFHRVVIRTMSALTPIASARGDRETLELAADWFERWRSTFPGSPYGTVLHLAIDLRVEAAGLGVVSAFDEGRLGEGLGLLDDSPSWLAAVEQIVSSRVAAGDAAGARWAFDRYGRTLEVDMLPRWHASVALCRAWVLAAEGRVDEGRGAAREAADLAELERLPWWLLRALEAEGDPASLERRRSLALSLGLPAG